MEIFLDSADIEQIKKVKAFGLLDGITTNPSLIKKAAEKHKIMDMAAYIKKILKVAGKAPVSLEVIGTNYDTMLSEAELLIKRFGEHGNIYIKIPVNPCFTLSCSKDMDGIKAIKALKKKKIKVNCTLVFSPEQALLAAQAGAAYVSPFIGRYDDMIKKKGNIKFDIKSGVALVEEIVKIFRKQGIKTKVLAASIRNVKHFRGAAESGADIVTMPFKIIEKLIEHEKTAEGMKKFEKDVVPEYARLLRKKKK